MANHEAYTPHTAEDEEVAEQEQPPAAEPETLQVGHREMQFRVERKGEFLQTDRSGKPSTYEKVERNRRTGEITDIGDKKVEYIKKTLAPGYSMVKIGDDELVKSNSGPHKGEVEGIGGPWRDKFTRVVGDAKRFFRPWQWWKGEK